MSIFSRLFGDKRLEAIDDQIDQIVSNNLNNSVSSQEDITASNINNFLSLLSKSDISENKEIDKLFQNVSVPRERLNRYEMYEELYRTVPIIKRIMRVYKANILQKNPVTGSSLLIKKLRDKSKIGSETFDANLDTCYEFAETILTTFKINQKLSTHIVPRMTLYGDCFVELVDINKEEVKISPNYLSEIREFEKTILGIRNQYDSNQLDNALESFADLLVEVEEGNNQNNQIPPVTSLNQISIKIHKPHNIIILETEYGTRLGYLEISQTDQTLSSPDVGRMLLVAAGKLNTLSSKSTSQSETVNKLINFIIKKIIEKNRKKIKSNDIDSVLRGLGDDLYNFVKKLYLEQNLDPTRNPKRIKTRFIPANRIVHFSLPSADNLPFGESIVDPLIFPAKLYILSQLSNVITKLSRASLVRTWTIETGASLMHTALAQQLKRELYNSRVTLEDLGNFKSIPKILSDYKDMFLFSKGGQKSIDVDIKSYADPSIKVADLEDARRELISLSGIPAPYLGYMDVVELREQLVHSNVSFATEIVDIQENINAGLNKLLDIFAEICNFQMVPSDYVSVNTIPPIVLLLQLTEMTITSAGNIMGVFSSANLPFDPYFFLEKYVPYLNWEDFKKAADDRLKEETAKAELSQNVQSNQ